MEWIKKYWSIIVVAIGIVSTSATAQFQIAANTSNNIKLEVKVDDAVKELKEDIKSLEQQRTEQAVIKANQENIKDDLKEIKDLLRSINK